MATKINRAKSLGEGTQANTATFREPPSRVQALWKKNFQAG